MEICTVGSVRGESVGAVMVDLNGTKLETADTAKVRPTALRVLLYSERCPVCAARALGQAADVEPSFCVLGNFGMLCFSMSRGTK